MSGAKGERGPTMGRALALAALLHIALAALVVALRVTPPRAPTSTQSVAVAVETWTGAHPAHLGEPGHEPRAEQAPPPSVQLPSAPRSRTRRPPTAPAVPSRSEEQPTATTPTSTATTATALPPGAPIHHGLGDDPAAPSPGGPAQDGTAAWAAGGPPSATTGGDRDAAHSGETSGSGGGRPSALGPTASDLRAYIAARIRAHRYYPALARRRGIEGTVGLSLTIAADGSVDVRVVRSADPSLDEAARQAVLAAAPLPVVSGRLDLDLDYRLDSESPER